MFTMSPDRHAGIQMGFASATNLCLCHLLIMDAIVLCHLLAMDTRPAVPSVNYGYKPWCVACQVLLQMVLCFASYG